MGTLDTLIDEMILLPEDRQKLLDRGFTNAIIERYHFRSCHPDNDRLIRSLTVKIPTEDLVREMVYIPSRHHQWQVNPQLLDNNILIPYYNSEGQVMKIRPHFFGFKGQPAMVYRTFSSFEESLVCVIAESEFKAVAAEAFGYSSIGIPGISSMSGVNWDYFCKELESVKAEEFVICFDNEVKDDPELARINPKRYKADWRKRYDTFIYAYAMATKILEIGRTCKIATLPAEWMEVGKIDIDLALKQGRTVAEFTNVINNALPTKKYLRSLPIPDKHRPWVTRRIRRFFFKSMIEIKNNEFWSIGRVDPKTSVREDGKRLTNCTIHIKNMYENSTNGVVRDVVLTDEYGIESRPTQMTPSQMSTKNAFMNWLMGQGNYLYYGGDKEVVHIWEHIFSNDDSNIVYLLNGAGFMHQYNFWLFDNSIFADGKYIPVDDNGIAWHNDVGYKINKPNDVTGVLTISEPDDKPFDMQLFLQYLADTCDYENPGLAKALVAWILSTLFSDPIFNKLKIFPILNFYGIYSGGKTTVIRWLLNFVGDQAGTLIHSLKTSSIPGITRILEYYNAVPVILDDWRAAPEFEKYLPLFLGVYGRQSGVKGVRQQFGIKETKINSTLAILGEDMINDGGVVSRCLSFHFPEERIHERMSELTEMAPRASKFTHSVLTDYENNAKKILEGIHLCTTELEKEAQNIKINRRVLFNYSILLSTYRVLIGDDKELKDFIMRSMIGGTRELTQNNRLASFAEEFLFGVTEGLLQNHHYKFEGTLVTLWVRGIHDTMNKYYGRTVNIYPLLVKLFSQRKYFVRMVKAQFPGSKGRLPAIVLDMSLMPEEIKMQFEGAYDGSRNAIKKRSPEVTSSIVPSGPEVVVVQEQ